MNVTEFLDKIKQERLSGREFLALIGHTGISNEDYTEIKENPSMTYSRLVQILENAPITSAEYEELLKTARYRSAKQSQKKSREELESQLSEMISNVSETSDTPETPDIPQTPDFSETPDTPDLTVTTILSNMPDIPRADKTVPIPDFTEEITLTGGEYDSTDSTHSTKYSEPSIDELWDDSEADFSGDFDDRRNLDTPDLLDEYAEYGGRDDFDRDARRENLAKTVICFALGLVLTFSSFAVRYFGLTDTVFTPQSYTDIVKLNESLRVRENSQTDGRDSASLRSYRAENFTQSRNPLSQIVSNERYIFKLIGNDLYAVEIESGHMSEAAAYESFEGEEILGIFEQGSSLYALYDYGHSVGVRNFAAFHELALVTEYSINGRFREVILHENGFLIITDFSPFEYTPPVQDEYNILEPGPEEEEKSNDFTGTVPWYTIDKRERYHIDFSRIEFIPDTGYSNMTVVGAFSDSGMSVYAVHGDFAESVVFSDFGERGGSLIMSFYREDKNTSELLRYGVVGNSLVNPIRTSVAGRVRQGFTDERFAKGCEVPTDFESGNVVRVIADTGESAVLHIFNDLMRPISPKLGKIAVGEFIADTVFDENAVYVIASASETLQKPHQVYAADTSDAKNPVFMNSVTAMISDEDFYKWGDERFFSIKSEPDSNGRAGVTVTMYSEKGNSAPPSIEAVYHLSADDEKWYDGVRTSLEVLWERGAASSYDFTSKTGVIVLPVTYFNVSRIESFFLLGYAEDTGFRKVGSIVDITSLRHNRSLAAVIQGGYVYTLWDDVVKSAMTDGSVINTFSFEAGGSHA
ncbi:MAG: hypothetical protein FWF82_02770 [Oscillospiraceae bacterium]|nr:hypothetical protein [Oscillospiraceae bacterium]